MLILPSEDFARGGAAAPNIRRADRPYNIELNYANEITSVKATSNTALTYIQIPNTVVSINDNAFTGCTALTDFNYNGTVEQWGAITLADDWKNNAAFTVVHCTDGDVNIL